MAKILLVEDDNNLREIYGARLTAEGYEIVSAADGEEALAIAVKEKPDLIISDIMMPKVSGFDMLDILRNAPETKDTKIIMMTALSQAEDKERADKLGADLYLVKSQVTLEDVAASVHKILDDSQQEPAKENSPAAPPAVSNEPPAEAPQPAPAAAPVAPPQAPPEPPKQEPAPPVTPAPVADSPAPPVAAPAPSTPVPAAEPPKPTDDPTPAKADEPQAPPAPTPAPAGPPTDPTPAPSTTPTTDQSSAPPAPLPPTDDAPKAPPKKIEVVLPDDKEDKPPQEAPVKDSSAPPAAAPAPAQPETEQPSPIGPTLAEALADEEKNSQGQAGDFDKKTTDDKPAEQQVDTSPSAVIKPQTSAMEPAGDDNGDVAEQQKEAPQRTSITLGDSSPGKKVIEPINDPNAKPDLNALLAKEEEAQGIPAPGPSTTLEPSAPDNPQAPSENTDNSQSSTENPDDLSKISL